MRDWDPQRACFWLIAAILAVHAIVVLASVTACLVYARDVLEGKFVCDRDDRLSALLSGALAAALAFAGGKK